MGRPKKIKTVAPDEGQIMDADKGVPGMFQPQEWDIAEEMQGNEALLEYRRESDDFGS
jgi:hypothetical protein